MSMMKKEEARKLARKILSGICDIENAKNLAEFVLVHLSICEERERRFRSGNDPDNLNDLE
jgi:hypothetical protein